jgi:hypothetical protein
LSAASVLTSLLTQATVTFAVERFAQNSQTAGAAQGARVVAAALTHCIAAFAVAASYLAILATLTGLLASIFARR